MVAFFFSDSLGLQHNFWCSEGWISWAPGISHQSWWKRWWPSKICFSIRNYSGHSGDLVTKRFHHFPLQIPGFHTPAMPEAVQIFQLHLGRLSISEHRGALEPWLCISKTFNRKGSRMVTSKVMFHMHPSLQNPNFSDTWFQMCYNMALPEYFQKKST